MGRRSHRAAESSRQPDSDAAAADAPVVGDCCSAAPDPAGTKAREPASAEGEAHVLLPRAPDRDPEGSEPRPESVATSARPDQRRGHLEANGGDGSFATAPVRTSLIAAGAAFPATGVHATSAPCQPLPRSG